MTIKEKGAPENDWRLELNSEVIAYLYLDGNKIMAIVRTSSHEAITAYSVKSIIKKCKKIIQDIPENGKFRLVNTFAKKRRGVHHKTMMYGERVIGTISYIPAISHKYVASYFWGTTLQIRSHLFGILASQKMKSNYIKFIKKLKEGING